MTTVASRPRSAALPETVVGSANPDLGLPRYFAYRDTPETRSRRDDLLERVVRSITAGVPPIGVRSSEAELAQSMGISRTPLREVLAILARDGLIYQVPQVGFFVVRVSVDTVREIMSLREAVEPMAAVQCASTQHERSGSLAGFITAQTEAHDLAAFGAADTAFHAHLLSRAGYANGARALATWRNQLRVFRTEHPMSQEDRASIIEEHRTIAVAIEEGDFTAAHDATFAHLHRTQERLIGAPWLPRAHGQTRQTAAVQSSAARSDQQHSGLRRA